MKLSPQSNGLWNRCGTSPAAVRADYRHARVPRSRLPAAREKSSPSKSAGSRIFAAAKDGRPVDLFTISTARERGYLVVRATGTHSMQRARELIGAVESEAVRDGATRVLLDVSGMLGNPSTIERYEIGVALAETITIKLAVVVPLGVADGFAETTAVNRGARVRVFEAANAAVAWLLAE
jgi:hypothetical protein